MSGEKEYIIPTKLSDYVDTMEDWELVEYASRYAATSVYCINGASRAHLKEVMRVWDARYPGEEIPIMECYPPLASLTTEDLSQYIEEDKDD